MHNNINKTIGERPDMTKYIWNKMKTDWKETVGNILLTSCLIAILIVGCQLAGKITDMLENDWYKKSVAQAAVRDPFIKEKLGMILWTILIIVAIIVVFCFMLYGLKIKLDVTKEGNRIGLFQVLGYTTLRRSGSLYIGKMLEIIPACVIGSVAGFWIWKILCKQKVFAELILLMKDSERFLVSYAVGIYAIFALWTYVNVLWQTVKKRNLAMILKGTE